MHYNYDNLMIKEQSKTHNIELHPNGFTDTLQVKDHSSNGGKKKVKHIRRLKKGVSSNSHKMSEELGVIQ